MQRLAGGDAAVPVCWGVIGRGCVGQVWVYSCVSITRRLTALGTITARCPSLQLMSRRGHITGAATVPTRLTSGPVGVPGGETFPARSEVFARMSGGAGRS